MITQWINDRLAGGKQVVIDFPNGGFFKAYAEKNAFIQYHTGDCVWLSYANGEYKVTQIDTYDDVQWKAPPENENS